MLGRHARGPAAFVRDGGFDPSRRSRYCVSPLMPRKPYARTPRPAITPAAGPVPAHQGLGRARRWLLTLALLGAVAWVYKPVISAGYIWDDNDYVSDNRNLDGREGLGRIWLDPRSSPQYYPLVFTSFWLERQAFGTGPAPHHVVNACLHAVNALLLWAVLRRLKVRGAEFVALVFAVHPVHVESVAWITERKNVLSGMFYLAALWAYLRVGWTDVARRPSAAKDAPGSPWGWYTTSLLLFGCALLSKTVTATLPAALLLLHWWKNGRVTARDFGRVTPFLVLGALAGAGTAWLEVHHVGAAGDDWTLGFFGRVLLAGRVPWFYAQKLVWPHPLVFIYPRWDISASGLQVLYPLATVASLSALYVLRDRVGRGPVCAVAFFLLTLSPAMGFLDVYPMRYSYVADHFQYLASIGVIALLAGTSGWLLSRLGWSRATVGLAGVTLLALAATARVETRKYQGLEALWLDTLAKNPGAWMAHNNLGTMALRQQRWAAAEQHFEAALAIKADLPEANKNLGTALYSQGKIDAATTQYRAAVAVKPDDAGAWNNLGIALAAGKRYEEAVRAYQSALAATPDYAMAHYNLGNVYSRMSNVESANVQYREAIRLDPNLGMAHYLLGLNLLARGKDESGMHLRRAFELMPGFGEGHFQVANAQLQLGQYAEAIDHYTAAIALNAGDADAYCNRGTALLQVGRVAEAARDYAEALRLKPGDAVAQAGLARTRAQAERAAPAQGVSRR